MALTRLKSWVAGEILAATDLNAEINNILNNALTLVFPLTGDAAFGGFRLTGLSAGSEASPGLQFTSDSDTGIRSSAANTLELVTAGADRWQVTSAGHLLAVDDALYDIGATGATRPRHVNASGDVVAGGQLKVAGAGPHAIGVAPVSTVFFKLGGTPGSAFNYGMSNGVHLTPVASVSDSFVAYFNGNVDKAGSGTHGNFGTLRLDAPSIGGVGATLTNASTLKIATAPTEATNNYGFWLAAGSFRLDANAVLTNSGAATLTLPTATDTLVGRATTDTLTNKTLTAPTIADLTNAGHNHQGTTGGGQLNATSIFSAGTVPTARLGSGSASSTTFLRGDQTWAAQNFGTAFESADQTVTLSTILSVAHGFGVKPKLVQVVFKNVTTELNYSVGDEVDALAFGLDGAQAGRVFSSRDATNVTIFQGSRFLIPNKTTGAVTDPTPANWKWVVRAWN